MNGRLRFEPSLRPMEWGGCGQADHLGKSLPTAENERWPHAAPVATRRIARPRGWARRGSHAAPARHERRELGADQGSVARQEDDRGVAAKEPRLFIDAVRWVAKAARRGATCRSASATGTLSGSASAGGRTRDAGSSSSASSRTRTLSGWCWTAPASGPAPRPPHPKKATAAAGMPSRLRAMAGAVEDQEFRGGQRATRKEQLDRQGSVRGAQPGRAFLAQGQGLTLRRHALREDRPQLPRLHPRRLPHRPSAMTHYFVLGRSGERAERRRCACRRG